MSTDIVILLGIIAGWAFGYVLFVAGSAFIMHKRDTVYDDDAGTVCFLGFFWPFLLVIGLILVAGYSPWWLVTRFFKNVKVRRSGRRYDNKPTMSKPQNCTHAHYSNGPRPTRNGLLLRQA